MKIISNFFLLYITNDICEIINKRCKNSGFSISEADFSAIPPAPQTANDIQLIKTNSSGLFSNIGGKIKCLAQILTWTGIIVFGISGFTIMGHGYGISPYIIGSLVILLGFLISWISSFLLYGFGQLVENSNKMVEYLRK